jgi:hypothetical protein
MSNKSYNAIVAMLRKQLQREKQEIVRNVYYKVFSNLNPSIRKQLWIEAQL